MKETDKVAIYEVTLDVWQGVFAWGWLCLPKDLKAGERRPVVVCQHGLEGLPEDTFTENQSTHAWQAYRAFALRLAEEGFVTFAPHNPYRGKDAFRMLQRKLNPMGLTFHSVINGQHQRMLEWLKAQPFARPDRIAFYGLSYGGKSACWRNGQARENGGFGVSCPMSDSGRAWNEKPFGDRRGILARDRAGGVVGGPCAGGAGTEERRV